jgi:hypothetical protein
MCARGVKAGKGDETERWPFRTDAVHTVAGKEAHYGAADDRMGHHLLVSGVSHHNV